MKITHVDARRSLNDIKENYDAFFIENKYGVNTHAKEFELLGNYFTDELSLKALSWIKNCYDCWYVKDQDEKGAFSFLDNQINVMEDKG